MDCKQAQEAILEALDAKTSFPTEHLADCAHCREFAQLQSSLDLQLGKILVAPPLSPAFRASLKKTVQHSSPRPWPESLPDIAHVTGCAVATILCAAMLPVPSSMVILSGAALTAVTYAMQCVVRGLMEEFN